MAGLVYRRNHKSNPAVKYKRRYKDELGAYRILKKEFGGGIEAALREFGAEISPAEAKEWDVGVTDHNNPVVALIGKRGAYAIGAIGWANVPVNRIVKVFRF